MRRDKFLLGILICVCIALLVDILANTVWRFNAADMRERGAAVEIVSATIQNEEETEADEEEDDDEYSASFEHTFEIQNEWKNHYDAEMTLKNTGDNVIKDWEVAFRFDGKIENIRNARIVSHDDDIYVIKNDGNDGDIKAGERAAFGFTVQYREKKPQEPYDLSMDKYFDNVHSEDYDIKLKQITTQESEILGQISIKNKSEQTIERWRFYFGANFEIVNIRSAKTSERERDTDYISYVMYSRGSHQNIEPGETITILFTGRLLEDKKGAIYDDFLEQLTIDPYDEYDDLDEDDCIWEGDEEEEDPMTVVDDEIFDDDDFDQKEDY